MKLSFTAMLCPKFNFPFSIFLILGKSNKFGRCNQNDQVKTKDLRARSSNYALEDIILMNTPRKIKLFCSRQTLLQTICVDWMDVANIPGSRISCRSTSIILQLHNIKINNEMITLK